MIGMNTFRFSIVTAFCLLVSAAFGNSGTADISHLPENAPVVQTVSPPVQSNFGYQAAWSFTSNQPVGLGSFTITKSVVFDKTWSANTALFGGSTLGKNPSLLGGPGLFLSKYISGTTYLSIGGAMLAATGLKIQEVGYVGLTGNF